MSEKRIVNQKKHLSGNSWFNWKINFAVHSVLQRLWQQHDKCASFAVALAFGADATFVFFDD